MSSNADNTTAADKAATAAARARADEIRAAGDTPHRVAREVGEIHDVVTTAEAMRLLASGGYSARLTPLPR